VVVDMVFIENLVIRIFELIAIANTLVVAGLLIFYTLSTYKTITEFIMIVALSVMNVLVSVPLIVAYFRRVSVKE